MNNYFKRITITIVLLVCVFFCSCNLSNTNTESRKIQHKNRIILCDELPYYGFIDISKIVSTNKPYEGIYINSKKKYRDKIIKTYKTSKKTPDFIFTDYKDGVEIVKYVGKKTDVVLPENIGDKKVIKIGGYIEQDNKNDDEKFFYSSVFSNKKIQSITISRYVKEIVFNTFEGDDLVSEDFDLKSIKVDDNNPYYSSDKGILYNKSKTMLLCVPVNYDSKVINVSPKVKIAYDIVSSLHTEKIIIRNPAMVFSELTDPNEKDDIDVLNEYYNKVVVDERRSIYGEKGSTAEKYAKKNGFKFVALKKK